MRYSGLATLGVLAGCLSSYAAEPPGSSGQIVFTSLRDGRAQIYLMQADGTDVRRLTTSDAQDDFPLWAPDGKHVSFLSNRDGNWELYAMNADGSHVTRLTETPGDEHSPSWSPDGKAIAFSTNRDDGNWEIYVMNADGSHPRDVSKNPAKDYSPNWSPDGTRIAFVSDRDGNANIYTMSPDGSDVHQLTNQTAGSNGLGLGSSPWSPDSKKLVYLCNVGGKIEICVLDLSSHARQQLTHNNAPVWNPAEPSDKMVNVSASWSPGGKSIVFVSDRDGNSDIFVMNADGSGAVNLTHNPAADYSPDWHATP